MDTIIKKLRKILSLVLVLSLALSCGMVSAAEVSQQVEYELPVTYNATEASPMFENYISDTRKALLCELVDLDLVVVSADIDVNSDTGAGELTFNSENSLDITIDENGNLMSVFRPLNHGTKITQGMFGDEIEECYISLIPKVIDLFEISGENYQLVDVYEFDDEIVFLTIAKQLSSGLINPYQSINLVFEKNSRSFAIMNRFNFEPNVISPTISEEVAIDIGEGVLVDGVCDGISLTYVQPAAYGNTSEEYFVDCSYLAYKISFDNGNTVVVIDAVSGELIGIDISLADDAKSFVISESATSTAFNYNGDYNATTTATRNQNRLTNAQRASTAFSRLGYTDCSYAQYNSSSITTDIQNYVKNNTNAYGLYVCSHGSASNLGFASNANNTNQNIFLETSDVSGNWHFVFLDACSTASTTGWATAFNIYGQSNRAFLGWSTQVYLSNTYLFNQSFWPMLDGNISVREAAVNAAATVPGSGTTPIKFYGDTTYTGASWS